MIGDSHTENFSPRQIERVLGEKTIKLSIEGSVSAEQSEILRTAIATGQVERVIWGLDPVAFRRSPESAFDLFYVPRHLYEGGPRALAGYILALDTLTLSLEALLGTGHRDLETLNRWGDAAEFGYPKVRNAWHQRMRKIQQRGHGPKGRSIGSATTRERIDRHLFALVRAHPQIEFDLFFPPYSVLAHLGDLHASRREFEQRVDFKRTVVAGLAPFDNARIFDFQQAAQVTHDFRNYKDLHHYAPEINDYMVASIAAGRHEVDARDYERALREFVTRIERFHERACAAEGALAELCPEQWPAPAARPR